MKRNTARKNKRVVGIVGNCENLERVWFELATGAGKGWLVGVRRTNWEEWKCLMSVLSGVMRERKGRVQVRQFLSFSNVGVLDRSFFAAWRSSVRRGCLAASLLSSILLVVTTKNVFRHCQITK